jgi:uncharacterized protein (TIGR02594 family)
MQQPAWLEQAWLEFGQAEQSGAASNPRIVALYRDAGHPAISSDEVAWCAAFLGACLQRVGLRGTQSLMARSYAKWGEELAQPRPGAIAVLTRTQDPALGHVGFVVGATGDDVFLLGGNQADAVSVERFPRSRLLALRWPATPAAPGILDIFDRALRHVLQMEGGFSDDPHDPGGPTNKGITLGVYAAWKGEDVSAATAPRLRESLKQIADDDVREIYLKRYWRKAGCPTLPPALALMHFDTGVNHGPVTAIRILQEVVGTVVDGELGPATLKAIAAKPLLDILAGYASNRRARYRAMPHFWRFGRGWLTRVERTLDLARDIAGSLSNAANHQGDWTMTDAIAPTDSAASESKWWGSSLTIWGAVTTGLAAILPVLGPLLGLELTADLITALGQQTVAAVQALVALAGTLMTIAGRVRAAQPIERRAFNVRL